MTRMRLLLPDVAVDGKGSLWGAAGERQGRFLSQTPLSRSGDMQKLAFIEVGQERVRVRITDCNFGGFWGIEASFHEVPNT